MLSFSISYWNLIKSRYFADAPKRGDRGWKQNGRGVKEWVTLQITLLFLLPFFYTSRLSPSINSKSLTSQPLHYSFLPGWLSLSKGLCKVDLQHPQQITNIVHGAIIFGVRQTIDASALKHQGCKIEPNQQILTWSCLHVQDCYHDDDMLTTCKNPHSQKILSWRELWWSSSISTQTWRRQLFFLNWWNLSKAKTKNENLKIFSRF